jgi:prepilin-type N-terminal cleavage/methylation domain-containing protein
LTISSSEQPMDNPLPTTFTRSKNFARAKSFACRPGQRGFTLIEVLVVIAIIALLIGLLLPAIQHVRESANRAVCTNHLKQVGVAVHNYVSNVGFVPAEGGAPSANGGPGDSASIFFNLLPYLEQTSLYNSVDGPGQNAVVNQFLCPSDQTNAGGLTESSGATLGSYAYSLYEPTVPASGVFPPFTTPSTQLTIDAAMTDGTSTTIIVGEHVQFCGGGAGGGGGPGGENPWGTTQNKRFPGSTSLTPRAIVAGVNAGLCIVPPAPAPGVSVFSAGHSASLHFLMGDGSARSCSASIDVAGVLVPALTARAGDTGGDF